MRNQAAGRCSQLEGLRLRTSLDECLSKPVAGKAVPGEPGSGRPVRLITDSSVEWWRSEQLVEYSQALELMEQRVEGVHAGRAEELVWLLEHPSLYSFGTSAKRSDLLDPRGLPVVNAGRGGQLTYHGPGQRIAYVMLDLRGRGQDVRKFIWQLEEWVIETLSSFGLKGKRCCGRIGVWIDLPSLSTERKIAAVGVRIRRWITFHGLALNLDPELGYYEGIVPCGLPDCRATSIRALGCRISMCELDAALVASWDRVFG